MKKEETSRTGINSMQSRGETELNSNEISLLNQLIKTAENSFEGLKKAYEKEDSESFNKLKATLIQTQRRISEVVK